MSSRRSAQRRHRNRNHVQTVVQILLEPAVGDELAQVAVGGGNHADVDLNRALGSEWLELAFLENAQQLRLHRRGDDADLVEQDRAAVGERKPALLVGHGAGERAAHVAEELGFDQRLGQRRTVHPHERHLALCAPVVNGARDEFLAGAGLAGDEHGTARLRHEARRADHLLNRPAPADDAVVIVLLVALGDEVIVMGPQPAVLEGAADDDEKLVDLERLLQVVERAELHRFDRALHGGVRRHHEDLRPLAVARSARDLPNEVEAAQLGHQVVDDQQVERPIAEQLQRLSRAAGGRDVVSFVAQRLRQAPAGSSVRRRRGGWKTSGG